MTKRKVRRCVVLREIEIPFSKVKKGDLFRMDKATKTDIHVDPTQWWLAGSNAKLNKTKGNHHVEADGVEILVHENEPYGKHRADFKLTSKKLDRHFTFEGTITDLNKFIKEADWG